MWVLAAGIVVLTAIAYAPVRHFDFVQLDDPAYVTENPHVRGGLTGAGVWWALTSGHAANWHPLTWVSHMLDVSLFGVSSGAMHLMNLALHITSTLLLLFWLRRVTGDAGPSAFVAAMFALHPTHVESVAWVAERKDVLSGLMLVLTLWAYSWYVERPRLGRYCVVLVLFALGLMAKPMLVTVPLLLLLIDWWPLGRIQAAGWAPAIRDKLPMLALSIASSIITFVAQRSAGAMSSVETLSLMSRVENAVLSYVRYLGKLVWPVDLTVFYGRPEPGAGIVVLAALGLLVVSVVAWRGARSRPFVTTGWFWYLVSLLPVIGLVQVGVQAMADRFTYVPFIGLIAAVAWTVRGWAAGRPGARNALFVLAVAIVAACTALTRLQVPYWATNTVLFAHVSELTFGLDRARANNSIGVALLGENRVDEALASFLEAERANPADVETQYNLGIAYARLNRVDEAVAHYREAIRLKPDQPETYNNLGSTLAGARRLEEAIAAFESAVRINPGLIDARLNLALAYAALNRRADAMRELQAVLQRDPSNARARALLDKISR